MTEAGCTRKSVRAQEGLRLRCKSSGHKCAGQELAAQSCRTRTLAIVVGREGDWKAQSRDGGSEGLHWWRWSRLRQRKMAQGFAGGGGGGGGKNVKWPFGHPPRFI